MLSELCQELKNWFDGNTFHLHGAFTISEGKIADTDFRNVIQENQYFRISGSVFNDGVYQWNDELQLTDELFVGSVVLMAVPKEVIALSKEIDDWQKKYGGADSSAMSPFQSESFGGYSYSKGSGSGSASGGGTISWQNAFASRLNKWRKI